MAFMEEKNSLKFNEVPVGSTFNVAREKPADRRAEYLQILHCTSLSPLEWLSPPLLGLSRCRWNGRPCRPHREGRMGCLDLWHDFPRVLKITRLKCCPIGCIAITK